MQQLKSGTKTGTEVTLNLSLNAFDKSCYDTDFPHELLLTNTQVSRICKTCANDSSANIKFLKNQLSKMVQLGGI